MFKIVSIRLLLVILSGYSGISYASTAKFSNEKPECLVTVKADAVCGLNGVKLQVLTIASQSGTPGKFPVDAVFDANGLASVELPPGIYWFEVLHLKAPDTLIALRSDKVSVTRGKGITLLSRSPEKVTFSTQSDGNLTIDEFAIRSKSFTGELCWKSGESKAGYPTVISSPGREYRVRILARKDHLYNKKPLFAAFWLVSGRHGWQHSMPKSKYCVCHFEFDDGGPALDRVGVVFTFPFSQLKFDVPVNLESGYEMPRFITNRSFLSFQYQYVTKDEKTVYMHPKHGVIKQKQTYRLGGPLTPVAWTGIIKEAATSASSSQVVCGAELVDPRGHLVNLQKSNIDWSVKTETPKGPVDNNFIIDEKEINLFSNSASLLRVRVSYVLEKQNQVTLPPLPFCNFTHNGIKTNLPACWDNQAKCYLLKSRESYLCIEEVSGRYAAHMTEVRWHYGGNNARGRVGASTGKTSWVRMPFKNAFGNGLNAFASYRMLAHEIMHNFGYRHRNDEEMKAYKNIEREVMHKLLLLRWYLHDHPELTPEAALGKFRAYQRNSPVGIE